MSEQTADAPHDSDASGQREPVDNRFWIATGAVALALGLPFLVNPDGAWEFWVRVNEMSATPNWLSS